MNSDERLKAARDQLTLVLSFFSRAETKLSVVLGIDIGMLGFLASRFPKPESITIDGWLALTAFVLFNFLSLWNLYQGSFPQLDGGNSSLIYFREIATRTEVRFVDEFSTLSTESMTKDILGQVWRNSEILKKKFDHLVWSYNFMAFSIVPWMISIVFFVQ